MHKILLASFVINGTVDSFDNFFATVELELPNSNTKTSVAVMPISTFPCVIHEGTKFQLIKYSTGDDVIIQCVYPDEELGCEGEK